MQFSKPMIELVYQIRRLTPSDLKPAVKLANPELFDELQKFYYQKDAGTVVKALIKELFFLAGGEWKRRLEKQEAGPKQQVKVYRGQTIMQDKPLLAEKSPEQRKKRVYRGQVVMV